MMTEDEEIRYYSRCSDIFRAGGSGDIVYAALLLRAVAITSTSSIIFAIPSIAFVVLPIKAWRAQNLSHTASGRILFDARCWF